MERNIYLQTVSIDEAIAKVQELLSAENILNSEVISTQDAQGRVLAEPIVARYSSPTFHAAAMDGICVRADKTFGAREGRPVILKKGKDFVEINTGNPLPSGYDSVIMIEDVVFLDKDTASIEKPAFPWQHVRRIGEDIVATELIFPARHKLSAYDLGTLLSAGIFEVRVQGKIRVGIIPTGDEILDFRQKPKPKPGQVIESNSAILAALLTKWDIQPILVPPVKDDLNLLLTKARQLLSDVHVLVIGAGSSAGSKDFTRKLMEELGQVIVHGIKAMPGKPSLLGISHEGKLLVGAPGYPVSAVICFEYLLKPLLYWLRKETMPPEQSVQAILSANLPSKLGRVEFVRVGLGKIDSNYVCVPLPRGAGLVTSLSKATGMIQIPENSEGLKQGSLVKTRLLRSKQEIENNLLVIGSHDNLLDVLKNLLQQEKTALSLFSSHVGSMGGIKAIAQGYAHLAGVHLFDPVNEDYNFPFIFEIMGKDADVVLINLVIRQQGLIVAKSNPKNIKSLHDLVRKDVTFVNRQPGSGTRILLDYYLQKLNLDPKQIKGYAQEEFTHMSVAVNVLTGTADCGLGILAAARALDLDFVPLVEERYDLLMLKKRLQDPRIKVLLKVIKSPQFKAQADALGGYELRLSGQEMQPKR